MSITMSKTDNQNYACINIHIHQRLINDLLCGLQNGISMRLGHFSGNMIDRDVEISAIDTIIKLKKLTKECGEIEDVELD